MEIKILEENGSKLVVLNGRLDTMTSPALETAALQLIEAGKTLVFECENLVYISSAGLRVVLSISKQCATSGGRFVARNLNKEVRSVFDMTGFSRLINIE